MPVPRFVRAAATVDAWRSECRTRVFARQPDVCLLDIHTAASGIAAAAATIDARLPGAVVVMFTARATTTTPSPR
jgi:AmiR/NasT family two-component response regulator